MENKKTPKYSLEEIKQIFTPELIENEPELSVYFGDQEYMIIFYPDHCSFQRCDGSGAYYYSTFDEMINTVTVDGILLSRDWPKVTALQCDYPYSRLDDDFWD